MSCENCGSRLPEHSDPLCPGCLYQLGIGEGRPEREMPRQWRDRDQWRAADDQREERSA
jgi:hypothetical protein